MGLADCLIVTSILFLYDILLHQNIFSTNTEYLQWECGGCKQHGIYSGIIYTEVYSAVYTVVYSAV